MRTSEPVIVDPRRHDAALFDLDAVTDAGGAVLDSAVNVVRQLRDIGVGAAVVVPDDRGDVPPDLFAARADGVVAAADRLRVRPGRCVVVASDVAVVTAARESGFALVVGVARRDDQRAALDAAGADAVVADVGEIAVRTGDRRMSQLRDALQALQPPGNPAVFFDFDGTLSDIVDDPGAARPVPGAQDALRQLAARCPVAVLSGRDLVDVTKRVGLPGIWYAGSHGFELTAPDGTHHQNEDAAAAIPVLERAAGELRERVGSIPGVVVEHKRFGVAVHYRNAARERVGEVAAAVRAAGRHDALRVTTGREVIELRPDIDWDKGKTLRWVLEHLHRAGSGPLTPMYLGDDITDEDAFDAVRDGGVPILVRHDEDGDRATAALFGLDSPAAVSEFTARLARRLADAQVN
ncbi:trehalose-phosphatase [Mycobacterium parmense]|uniref:Trehalose 6-phosphate phosphatase n=1 Tax=Mycobacterium parmense TaxID=185642 RepID=A0A7I7YWP0_9MYCO|nr:trehalose-phosphatase [Mycobacterium parmense]MCV7350885.1 trehalose-phosphatase [Mycobacterium parmense]ORW53924.1 trehalose phosphatase [Mycobacterium parmense]BBZ45682.1 trehalose-phosphate phosphatase [Mycobacterium parmense]